MSLKNRIVRALNRHVLPRHRLVLRKSGHEAENGLLTPSLRERMFSDIAAIAGPWLDSVLGSEMAMPASALPGAVADFAELHERRPVRDNSGGMGFNGSLWLYLFARALRPELIVESGTWQGHSAWLMAEAAPEAELITFDIEHDNLLTRHPRVDYRLGDWAGHQVVARARSMVFFDDHISHTRRLREAAKRGFRHCLFDDNVPANGVFLTGDPPLPTLAMLHDPQMRPGMRIDWRYREREFHYVASEDDWTSAALIEAYRPVPPLRPASPYREHLGLAYVRLRG
ncbi:MAG: hypothetical protein KIT20_14825 [Alphaproteobacteria bacterium]|nr:hypothetical protein [Alphaproteobacteria bacterium]